MAYIIGIDIGGTKIHGILMKGGRIIERVHVLHKKRTREAVLEVILRTVETLQQFAVGEKIDGIGIGVPSDLDEKRGTLLSAPNFPALRGLGLSSWLQRRSHIPIRLENDARCFVKGAKASFPVRSRGRLGAPIIVGLTIGTGLGGGVLVGKKIWAGAHDMAGEIGHTVIMPKGERCVCGQRGCLEMYASRKFIMRVGGKEPKELGESAFSGNRKAKKIYEDFGYNLGIGIANIANTLDPDAVVLGGGIANAHKLFLRVARKVAFAHIISGRAKRLPIMPAKNIDDAGALGAAMLFESF
ncbi:MAG: ROK family protein [bacterium]|nr:ROK family protein [bacterium]